MAQEKKSSSGMSRSLKNRHVQLIALGGTIGTGLFLGAGRSIHFAGPSLIFAYLIAGLACFFLMRALGELLLSNTEAVSFIDFIDKYLGPKTGFVAGWTYLICWITIAMAEVTAAGLYMQFWFPGLPTWVTGLFLLVILFFMNSITVSAFGETEFWFAIIKVVAILLLILAGVVLVAIHYKTPVGYASLGNLFGGNLFPNGAKGFLLSFQMVIFSFVGIEMIGMTASETADPQTIIPKSINDVPIRIILFYVGSLVALMCIYPWYDVSPTSSPFVQVFQGIGIKPAAAIINFVVLTAAASSCNSAIFTTGRMLYSLTKGSKNPLGKRLSQISRRGLPATAILVSTLLIGISVIIDILVPNGVFEFVSSVATTCFLFIWSLIVLAHWRYRRQLTTEQTQALSFKMPWYPFSNVFTIAFMIFVAIILLFQVQTLVALVGSIVWLLGLYGFDYYRNLKQI
ncbi:amino acid permease [Fructilactobacillus florum]|uniref:Transporter ydgF n=1 Tax=Fructilactobacillus florum DSM 22689 = JCM 16035 TaxID=1423745 RepID=A0A0R2CUE5_9LACO|nr:amino acid permease [Fructilactobacillus florum]EKK20940.1 D-serine, D-alanine, glycine transporter [Fructilactobacillus florum 2F]KRM91622.1 transporter ydgF [Fructilactobacillus florum DSM 22689 = JCM 16035]